MKKVFVDTSVIIDLLADRRPHSKFAIGLFEKAEAQKAKLFAFSLSFATTFYILKKYQTDKNLRLIMLGLLEYLNVIPLDAHLVKRGLKSKQRDFEDTIQILSAVSIDKMDCVVTRN